jgi:hypothetical protein
MEIASVGAPFAVLLLANPVDARPFPDLTVETVELTVEQSIELPTKEAVRDNQVRCGTLSDFDELIICVERTERVEYFRIKRGLKYKAFNQQNPPL